MAAASPTKIVLFLKGKKKINDNLKSFCRERGREGKGGREEQGGEGAQRELFIACLES